MDGCARLMSEGCVRGARIVANVIDRHALWPRHPAGPTEHEGAAAGSLEPQMNLTRRFVSGGADGETWTTRR